MPIRAGDVVHAPSASGTGTGPAADHFLTHLSVTDGPLSWGEHVTDDEYGGVAESP